MWNLLVPPYTPCSSPLDLPNAGMGGGRRRRGRKRRGRRGKRRRRGRRKKMRGRRRRERSFLNEQCLYT